MENVFYLLVALVVLALVSSLAMRAWNAALGATSDTSQRVMRWRVSLQLAAVVALGLLFAMQFA
jgi:hypothetical protein